VDIEEFYDQDPRRRASDEIEFGTEWTDRQGVRCAISWIADTGELYAMAEPLEPLGSDGIGDLYVQGMPTDVVTVEVLGSCATLDDVEQRLQGWEEAMTQRGSLDWVRARVKA
jgi:hypothetical protein